MKQLIKITGVLCRVLFVWCWVLAVEAAPPLRGVVPMRTGEMASGIRHQELPLSVTAPVEGGFCVSQALIGEGSYLQHTGSPRILTILAGFQDVSFTINNPVKAFDQYLNGDQQENLGNKNHLNAASVRQYFEVCSHGKFSPQFDVVGPITLPQTMAYYGGSNSTGTDDKFTSFCQDAVSQVKELVSDWSAYDNDDDGHIELVCIIFAGYGQNQGGADSTIWAKAAYQNQKLDNNLRISRFNCSPELLYPDYPTYINGTGVFIHEFSHCMGLPDLYATTPKAYVNNQGMESFSIMDYGLYNYNSFAPCPYTAWEQEVMGWTEIADIRSLMEDGKWQGADILPLTEGGTAYKLTNADNDRDYIVMENVQQTGLNKHADGHGLLVYHVDYPYTSVNMSDAPNNTPGHPAVAVVPAGGLLINKYLSGKDKTYTLKEWEECLAASTFPGKKEVTSLTSDMQLPNYCFYDNTKAIPTGYMLNAITENTETGTVSFSVVSLASDIAAMTLYNGKRPVSEVYDLQGRRVASPSSTLSSLKSGIYIASGRKVVVR